MDTISNPMDGKYTESKLVWFLRKLGQQVIYENDVCKISTHEEINSEISKFVQDGWTPVNVAVVDVWNFTILFCR